MINIGSNGQKIAYGIKHYNIDNIEDLEILKDSNNLAVGSTCFVISESKYYMLNGNEEWIEITPFGKTVSSSGGSGEGGGDSEAPDVPNDDIIYEGGII